MKRAAEEPKEKKKSAKKERKSLSSKERAFKKVNYLLKPVKAIIPFSDGPIGIDVLVAKYEESGEPCLPTVLSWVWRMTHPLLGLGGFIMTTTDRKQHPPRLSKTLFEPACLPSNQLVIETIFNDMIDFVKDVRKPQTPWDHNLVRFYEMYVLLLPKIQGRICIKFKSIKARRGDLIFLTGILTRDMHMPYGFEVLELDYPKPPFDSCKSAMRKVCDIREAVTKPQHLLDLPCRSKHPLRKVAESDPYMAVTLGYEESGPSETALTTLSDKQVQALYAKGYLITHPLHESFQDVTENMTPHKYRHQYAEWLRAASIEFNDVIYNNVDTPEIQHDVDEITMRTTESVKLSCHPWITQCFRRLYGTRTVYNRDSHMRFMPRHGTDIPHLYELYFDFIADQK